MMKNIVESSDLSERHKMLIEVQLRRIAVTRAIMRFKKEPVTRWELIMADVLVSLIRLKALNDKAAALLASNEDDVG